MWNKAARINMETTHTEKMKLIDELIDKYYADNQELKNILVLHSRDVADKALRIIASHPQLNADPLFTEEAAMLHDIGIFLTDAPGIHCFGTEPYICHGILGAKILNKMGWHRHARVCERHTGTGLPASEIIEQNLPLPHIDLVPETIEEQIICFADKFFSKTKLNVEKTPEQARRSLEKFGGQTVQRFDHWCGLFL